MKHGSGVCRQNVLYCQRQEGAVMPLRAVAVEGEEDLPCQEGEAAVAEEEEASLLDGRRCSSGAKPRTPEAVL